MFIHDLNPVLLKLGIFEIRYYGLVYAFGFLLVYYILNKKRDELELSRKGLETYMVSLILGLVIGARLFHVVFSDFSYYFNNPLKILFFWEGGMAFHGGLAGAVLVSYYFCKKNEISLIKFGDVIAIPAALALSLGRIANFINGELVGKVTDVSWCVNFQNYLGCRHPSQLYESLGYFLVFIFLLSLNKMKKGLIFWNFVFWIGIMRFFISFFRSDVKYFGLAMGQYFSLIMIIVGGYVLFKKLKK